MNDTTDLQKIKDRIAKLLAMAEDSSSPNEAAIAASRARKLMDKYQLDAMDCQAGFVEEFLAMNATRHFAAFPLYLSFFGCAIAKYNDCQAIFDWGIVDFKKKVGDRKKMGKALQFRGYQSDVEMCVQMYNSLEAAINKLCKEYMDGLGLPKYNVRLGGQFKHAAIGTITRRLGQMTKEREALTGQSGSTGTALIVAKEKAVAERFGEIKYKDGKAPAVESREDLEAFHAGVAAGQKVEIVRSIED
jgi:hypothetical protein